VSSLGYKRYVLSVLTAVYLLNLVDRGLMMLLLQPIKLDLHLSDTQLGFLTGIAFAIFYATMGVPIARVADHGNRVTLTSVAIGLWGATVIACGLVGNFFQLLLARMAAAVGEAGAMPPTYSLVGDYFPGAAERTRALSIYVSGGTLSALVSFILGGWINEHYGWRVAFLTMGIPGLLVAAIVRTTVAETREEGRSNSARTRLRRPVAGVFAFMWQQRSCRYLTAAFVVLYMVSLGLSPWYAAFLMRKYGTGTAELGLWLGLIIGLGGTLGVLAGGYIAGQVLASDEPAQLRCIAIGIACLVPCLVAFLTVSQKYQALLALIPMTMAFNFFFGPIYALLQRLVPDEMRATMLSIVMLLANLIGMGIGPQIVGVLSDLTGAERGVTGLRNAMLAMSFVSLGGSYLFWRASQTVRQDLLDRATPPLPHLESTVAGTD